MGACFEESMLFHLWSAAGVQFETYRAIEGQVRYTTHPNDHALTILYATDEDWSKNMRKRSVEVNGETVKVFDAIVNAIKVRTAELLTARGAMPPVITRASVVGEERSRTLFDEAYREHARRIARVLDQRRGGE